MKAVSAVAVGAVSALGRGRAAYAVGELGSAAPRGLVLERQLAVPRHPLVGRFAGSPADPELDRATWLLLEAAKALLVDLERRNPSFRSRRVGLIVGTSAGAMPSLTRALALRARGVSAPRELAQAANYASPVRALELALGLPGGSGVQVLGACASSTLALGLAARWLDSGECELVIAGGYDALSDFVAAGFDALGALTAGTPQPFRQGRDGMALGEGAALVALELARPGDGAFGRILGFSASSDAVHITAPDRTGRGLVAAARGALADAGVAASAVGFVSAHATSTPFNDAAEARALEQLFEGRTVAVQPWKAAIGHTLGAAGVLEVLSAWDGLAQKLCPAAPGSADSSAALSSFIELPPRNRAATSDVALKLSAAFGGANAALVLGSADAPGRGDARPRHDVSLATSGEWVDAADLARVARLGTSQAALAARTDELSALVLTAVARLVEGLEAPLPEATAVVVGSDTATLELDEAFECRRREGRPVEPRRFPPTSPNIGAGSCSIAFGLRGPAFAVGGGPGAGKRALLLAHELVAAGDAPAALAVLAEDAGPVVADLFGWAGFGVPARGARAVLLVRGSQKPVSRVDLAQEV